MVEERSRLTFLLNVARSWLYTSAIEATRASSAAQGVFGKHSSHIERETEARRTVRLLQ